MTLSLLISGEQRTFVTKFVKARTLRNAIKITSVVDFSDTSLENLDIMVGFLCDVYDNQFTIDDVYDGIENDKLIKTLISTLNAVIGGTVSKLEQIPNAEAEK